MVTYAASDLILQCNAGFLPESISPISVTTEVGNDAPETLALSFTSADCGNWIKSSIIPSGDPRSPVI
jgi:hypothetical protein